MTRFERSTTSSGAAGRTARHPGAAAGMGAVVLLLGVAWAAAPARAQDATPPGGGAAISAPAAAPATPAYRPPPRPRSGNREGGGTRGIDDVPAVLALIPDGHVGITFQEQPTLYWWISADTKARVELTLVDGDGAADAKPLFETAIPSPTKGGIHAFSFAEHGVRLAPDRVYKWYVTVVPDPAKRGDDVYSGGGIERVAPPADLAASLAGSAGPQRAVALAQAGVWYDALDAISADAQRDAFARAARASLLEQVGLGDAAAADRSARP